MNRAKKNELQTFSGDQMTKLPNAHIATMLAKCSEHRK